MSSSLSSELHLDRLSLSLSLSFSLSLSLSLSFSLSLSSSLSSELHLDRLSLSLSLSFSLSLSLSLSFSGVQPPFSFGVSNALSFWGFKRPFILGFQTPFHFGGSTALSFLPDARISKSGGSVRSSLSVCRCLSFHRRVSTAPTCADVCRSTDVYRPLQRFRIPPSSLRLCFPSIPSDRVVWASERLDTTG
jgi:hypothetical protein